MRILLFYGNEDTDTDYIIQNYLPLPIFIGKTEKDDHGGQHQQIQAPVPVNPGTEGIASVQTGVLHGYGSSLCVTGRKGLSLHLVQTGNLLVKYEKGYR